MIKQHIKTKPSIKYGIHGKQVEMLAYIPEHGINYTHYNRRQSIEDFKSNDVLNK